MGFLGTHAPQKRVPPFVFDQSSEMIAEFLLGHFMGDGTDSSGTRMHYTSSVGLADDLQTLAFLSGLESYVHVRPTRQTSTINGRTIIGQYPEHHVSMCERRSSSIDRKKYITTEHYAGEVFCAEVPTHHTLVTRRNGKILVSGNCTANGSLEAIGYLWVRDGKVDPVLSRLFTYWVSRVRMENVKATEDSGCIIRDVVKGLQTYGSPPEKLWPYSDDDVTFTMTPTQQCFDEAAKHKAVFYYRCCDLGTIKASIDQGFPVIFGLDCPSNMMSDECAATGVIKLPTPSEGFEGGHCMLFIGWDDKTRMLTGPNSWGKDWGDAGFFHLPYDFVDRGFINDSWTVRLAQE